MVDVGATDTHELRTMYSYAQTVPAARATESARATFIQQTYLHLGIAVLAFAGLELALFKTGIAYSITSAVATSSMGWLVVLLAFMAVGWLANRWAANLASVPMQYLGLGLYVLAEALIMAPLLVIASQPGIGGPDVIPTAGVLTGVVFAGLTGTVFFTKKDFSFLGKFLMVAMWVAVGIIVCAILFGFSLGMWFSVAMVGLAAGYILYYTSNILHHYPVGAHVAASLALFASVALLFWYIVQLVMSFSRD